MVILNLNESFNESIKDLSKNSNKNILTTTKVSQSLLLILCILG